MTSTYKSKRPKANNLLWHVSNRKNINDIMVVRGVERCAVRPSEVSTTYFLLNVSDTSIVQHIIISVVYLRLVYVPVITSCPRPLFLPSYYSVYRWQQYPHTSSCSSYPAKIQHETSLMKARPEEAPDEYARGLAELYLAFAFNGMHRN